MPPARSRIRKLEPVTVSCRSCPSVGAAVWSRCAGDEADALDADKVVRWVPRGTWLFRENDPAEALFVLLAGAVVIRRRNAEGGDVALNLVMPGTTLGFRGWIDGGRHRVAARCSIDSLVCTLPRPAAARALEASRDLEGVFFSHLADELAGAQDRMLQMTSLCVRDRMVLLLGSLIEHFGETLEHDTLRIAIPVSRIDMGALAGMTPETVSRCIRMLQAENLVHFTRTYALIPCRQRFLDELSRLGGETVFRRGAPHHDQQRGTF